mmetsp:Transcript_29250/g.41405  ORF Transcript_29250/g.41405 Transcript_29250/m.41405 type:complete len:308 (-) Transcript_29250:18-941(-)
MIRLTSHTIISLYILFVYHMNPTLSLTSLAPIVGTTTADVETAMDFLKKRILQGSARCTNDQYWVAIAGGPGSGKSTIAELTAKMMNELEPGSCVVLPMDGYHYTNDKLKELDPTGEITKRKGAPFTFDAERFVKDMWSAKSDKSAELPTYCREISDPVPGGAVLKASHKYVLVEGNYILLEKDEQWKGLKRLWDDKWFVKCSVRETQRQRLIQRTMETWTEQKDIMWGVGETGAAARVDFNDVKNMDYVAPCQDFANLLIINDEIMQVEWRSDDPGTGTLVLLDHEDVDVDMARTARMVNETVRSF